MNEERCLYCAKTKAECTGEPWADLSSHNFTPSPKTPEKQEGPQPEEFPNEFGYRKYQEGRRAGRAERDAEVEALKAAILTILGGLPSHPGHNGEACVPRCPDYCYRCAAEKALTRT